MEFLSYLISGISLGSVYAIIALGYTMVYGIAKMLNFAHGDVIMVGAYICFFICSRMAFSSSRLFKICPLLLQSVPWDALIFDSCSFRYSVSQRKTSGASRGTSPPSSSRISRVSSV